MWALSNKTSYAAERTWWRDKTGAHQWLVAVKASFEVRQEGTVVLADEQPPPLLAPEYHGEPGLSSLRWEADLMHPKPTTDILVDAHAHAPRGQAVGQLPVSLRVGDLRKVVLVHGLRVYYRGAVGLTVSEPRPFVTLPIRYEDAWGGTDVTSPDPSRHRADPRNPVGRGFGPVSALENQQAHQCEYLAGEPAQQGPAGFGPLDRHWQPRLAHAGTYDARWEAQDKPLLPRDYDPRFAQCAPADQQPPKPLYGGELVELVHMTPEGVLRFELPKLRLTFTTRIAGRREEHRATLSTLQLEPQRRRFSMGWVTALPVKAADIDYLDETVIGEKRFLT